MSGTSIQDRVVLLHGIGHTRWNMFGIERALITHGYKVINVTYPSRRRRIAANAEFLHERLVREGIWDMPGSVHFVGHSMGGLVTCFYLDHYRAVIPAEKMGRVVMLAPPIGGSEVADFLRDFPPYRWLFGPAGQELVTSVRSLDRIAPWYDTGIIAGHVGWPYIVARLLIKGAHDGRVSVEKTRLTGMKDHMVVASTHSFISWNRAVHKQIVTFLHQGRFAQ